MQSKPGSKKHLVRDKSTFWYRTPAFLIAAMLASLAIWFVGGLYVSKELDIKPKLLILRSEGCAYLQIRQIQTKPYPIEHTCSAEVPFRYLPFSENGIVHSDQENDDIFVNSSQIVAVESLPDRPWTDKQRRLAIYGAIGTLAMVGIMILMFVAL